MISTLSFTMFRELEMLLSNEHGLNCFVPTWTLTATPNARSYDVSDKCIQNSIPNWQLLFTFVYVYGKSSF